MRELAYWQQRGPILRLQSWPWPVGGRQDQYFPLGIDVNDVVMILKDFSRVMYCNKSGMAF
jgi:hypothetical protein